MSAANLGRGKGQGAAPPVGVARPARARAPPAGDATACEAQQARSAVLRQPGFTGAHPQQELLAPPGHELDPREEAAQGIKATATALLMHFKTATAACGTLHDMYRQDTTDTPPLSRIKELLSGLCGRDMPDMTDKLAVLQDNIDRFSAVQVDIDKALRKVIFLLAVEMETACIALDMASDMASQIWAPRAVNHTADADAGEVHGDVGSGAAGDERGGAGGGEEGEGVEALAHAEVNKAEARMVGRRSSSGSCSIAFRPPNEDKGEDAAGELVPEEERTQAFSAHNTAAAGRAHVVPHGSLYACHARIEHGQLYVPKKAANKFGWTKDEDGASVVVHVVEDAETMSLTPHTAKLSTTSKPRCSGAQPAARSLGLDVSTSQEVSVWVLTSHEKGVFVKDILISLLPPPCPVPPEAKFLDTGAVDGTRLNLPKGLVKEVFGEAPAHDISDKLTAVAVKPSGEMVPHPEMPLGLSGKQWSLRGRVPELCKTLELEKGDNIYVWRDEESEPQRLFFAALTKTKKL